MARFAIDSSSPIRALGLFIFGCANVDGDFVTAINAAHKLRWKQRSWRCRHPQCSTRPAKPDLAIADGCCFRERWRRRLLDPAALCPLQQCDRDVQ